MPFKIPDGKCLCCGEPDTTGPENGSGGLCDECNDGCDHDQRDLRITPEEAHEMLMMSTAEAMESVVNCITLADAIQSDPSIIDPIVNRLVEHAVTYHEKYMGGTPTDMELLRELAVARVREPLKHDKHDESEGYDCFDACMPWQSDVYELAADGLAEKYDMEMS